MSSERRHQRQRPGALANGRSANRPFNRRTLRQPSRAASVAAMSIFLVVIIVSATPVANAPHAMSARLSETLQPRTMLMFVRS
jgi:hypothetical protein